MCLIVGEDRVEGGVEFRETERIDRVDAAAGIGRDIEEKQRIATDAFIIDLQQIADSLDLRCLGGAPEPARTNGDVGLGGGPVRSAGGAAVEHLDGRTPRPRLEAFDFERGPVRPACLAPLIADPAAAGTDIAEDHRLRLQTLHGLVEQRPVVDLPAAGRTFSAGPVEPLFEDRAVGAAQDAFERPDESGVVGRRAVAGIVAVPGRDIDAEVQSLCGTGFREFAEHVALSIPPAALRHRMSAFR